MTKADKEGQRKTPVLRFKGFTDDWEQRELNEVTTRVLRKNKNLISKRPLTISAQYGLIDQQAFFNKQVASSNLENYLLLEKGEFAYNKSYSDGFPYGTIKKLNLYGNGAVSTLYIAFKANADINSDFLENLFSSNKWHNEVYKIAAEGARNHGLLNISPDDFFNIKITISKDSQEQSFISKFLRIFDNLLALYERKLKLLSRVKKYFLDNLFAKKEYPNLRFKGFTDAWKQRKLENLSEHKSGTSIEKYFSSDGLYKVISIGSYGLNNEYIDQGIRAVKNKTTESKLVRSGQLTMVLNDKTANGNLIGRCLLISKDNEFIVNQRTEIIIPGPDLNENYAYYYLNGPFRNKVKKIAQGGTQIYVNYSSVKRQKINYPIKNEQIKISKLFKIINYLITLYENKQQHLTEIKKTFLNTMFI